MKTINYLLTSLLTIASIAVYSQCQVNFSYTTAQNGLTVSFNNQSNHPVGMQMNYQWWFGDGNATSTAENPTYTYSQSGTYLGYLSMWDNQNSCFDSTAFYITVTAPCLSHLNYRYENIGNNEVKFFSQLGFNQNFQLRWDFGDGSIDTSNSYTITHTYANSGSYIASLTLTDPINNCSNYSIDTIQAAICQVGFNTVVSGDTVFITNTVPASNYTNMTYEFGDSSSSSLVDPIHLYSQSGTYTIRQTVWNNNTLCSNSTIQTITISNVTNCNASFTAFKDTATNYGVVLVNNSSIGSNVHYFWDFGDGNTAWGRTPTHQFANFGTYNVCLTITDSLRNCSATFCDSIGMNSNGMLESTGFGLRVVTPTVTSIEEQTNSLSELSFNPNPFKDQLTIRLPELEDNVQYDIFDMNGKLVREGRISNPVEMIELTDLESGIYMLRLNDGTNNRVEKLIKD